MEGNIKFSLVDNWTGVQNETDNGDVVEISHISYLTDDGIIQYAATGALNAFDCDEIFVVIAMFAHHESGCAWIYARHATSCQYVRIDIRSYETIGPLKHVYARDSFSDFEDIGLDDLPF